jgi:sugar phosphate isomerase/epimerase
VSPDAATPEVDGWVMWSGTLGLESPVEPRIGAAAAWGYTHLSVSPLDVARLEETGTSATDLGAMIRAAGLEIIVDPVMNWYPGGGPARSRFSRFSPQESLRMVAELGAVSMTAIGTGSCDGDVAALAEPFGVLCDQAAELGVLVHLEFIPMTVISSLAIARQIVTGADRPNGGILFDTWHFFRGDPDFGVLADTPGDLIFAVQLDDALAEVEGTLWEDTQRRLAPGDGALDLARAVRALADIGALRRVGPEIIHPDWAAMPAVEAAALSGDKTRAVIDDALAPSRRTA